MGPCHNWALTRVAKHLAIRKKVKENRIAIEIVQQIILKDISNQTAFNIMELEDPKEI